MFLVIAVERYCAGTPSSSACNANHSLPHKGVSSGLRCTAMTVERERKRSRVCVEASSPLKTATALACDVGKRLKKELKGA